MPRLPGRQQSVAADVLTRILTGVAILSLIVAYLSHQQVQSLQSDLAKANSRIVGFEELSRFNARAKAADVEWSKLDNELGVSDAPLSDYMSGVAGRVWP